MNPAICRLAVFIFTMEHVGQILKTILARLNISKSELFAIILTYKDYLVKDLHLSTISLGPIALQSDGSFFDITKSEIILYLHETF